MIDFFKRIFGIQPPASGATAKERLRLVLLSDHLSLAPDVIESLKRDLLEVISRYVEIDESHADVTFEHREREVAMLASVPIRAVRGRPLPPPARLPVPSPSNGAPVAAEAPPAAVAEPAEALPAASTAPEAPPESAEPQAEPSAPPAVVEPVPALALVTEPPPEASPEQSGEFAQLQPAPKPASSSTRRRRRRKKAAAAAAVGPLQMTASQF